MLKRRTVSALLAFGGLILPLSISAAGDKVTSFKGWEIYSWKSGDEWRFALILGTNRTKSCGEATNEKAALTLKQLLKRLEELEQGEYISWVRSIADARCELSDPPSDVIDKVGAACRRLRLHLGGRG